MRAIGRSKGKKVKKEFDTKLLLIVTGIGITIIASISLCFALASNKVNDFDTVVKINLEPIPVIEYQKYIGSNRALVYNYFFKKYNVSDSAEFWGATYGGENPLKKVKEYSLTELKKVTVEQLLLKKYGITKDISYKQFLKDLVEENRRRADSLKKGKVIYGPTVYGENEYFSYITSNRVIKLKEELQKNVFKISESDLKSRYAIMKETSFKIQDIIKVKVIEFNYFDKNGNFNQKLKDEAISKMASVEAQLSKGTTFEDLQSQYSKDNALTEKEFNDETARIDEISFSKMKEEASKLKVNEISKSFSNSDNEIVLIKCLEINNMGYREFTKEKEYIKTIIIDEMYKKLLEKLTKEAKLIINTDVYNSLKAD